MSDFSNCFSCDNKDLPVEGLLRAAFRCDEEGNVYIATVGNGSNPTPEPVELCVNVTYEELLALIQSETLVCGTYYTITDFATSHYLLDGGDTNGDEDYYTDPVGEPLTVLALSTSVVSQQAWSALHPEDIIIYDWNPDNFTDIPTYTSSNTSLLVPDFKGAITYRKDTILNVALYYDWRTAMNRRWAIEPDAWNISNYYYQYDFVVDSGTIYMCVLDVDPLDAIDISDTEYWAALDGIAPGAYVAWGSLDFLNMYVNPLDYQDVLTFQDEASYVEIGKADIGLNNFVFYSTAFNVYINNSSRAATFHTELINFTAGFEFEANFIIYANKVSVGNSVNSLYFSSLENVSMGNNCSGIYSVGGGVVQCSYGNHCVNNIITNSIYNTAFANSCSNIVMKNCDLSEANNFMDAVNSITLFGMTVNNVFYPGFSGTDFSGATHPYSAYSCTFLTNSGSANKVMYVDGSDTVQIADATD